MDRFRRSFLPLLLAVSLLPLACAGTAWRQALREDSPASYHRFLRDHPNSRYAENARARIDFHKVKRSPSLAAFADFAERYPNSPLLDELRPMLEEKAFGAARASGTPEAYDEFVSQFPRGPFSARAAGNAAWLRQAATTGTPAALRAFADAHPESDFAAEARRSAEAVALRDRTRFQRVALRIRIAPGTAEAERLAAEFGKRAKEFYEDSAIELVPFDRAKPAPAQLVIEHEEKQVSTQVSVGQISRPAVLAETRVSLLAGGEGPPVWQRSFSARISPEQHLDGTSVVFGPGGKGYWGEFFVPVATWQSSGALRGVLDLSKRVTAVDAVADRAVVLYQDGDFQLIELADPAAPVVLAQHQRERDLKQWDGVRALGDRIALFGEDGLELVRFTPAGSETVVALERGSVGTVREVQRLGDGLVLGTKRGIIVTGPDGSEPTRLLRRDVRGLAVVGDALLFSDGESVLVSSDALLKQGRVMAQLRLGRSFGPGRIRAFGSVAVVVADGGVLVLDLRNAAKPRVVSQLYSLKIGEIHDAAMVGGRIYLLGERGLHVLSGSGASVSEALDVGPRERVAVMGRHLVTIGREQLQVVDGTPFSRNAAAVPASTAR